MPIEIRELHIKAVVENASDSQATGQAGIGGGSESNEQLIRTCVEKVMELIKDAKER